MKVEFAHGDEKLVEKELAKSKPLLLTVHDGEALLQIVISEREFRVSGDGGATRLGTWEIDLAIPRVNERQ